MEKLGLNEIREKFLSFFESKEHYRHDSFPLIPKDDKSLLIINSGMAPLKPYFAGLKEPPARRMTTCQKCIRTLDIENVGYTSRHGTFFEMLGNFSFGDYFKHESLKWGWEFLTEVLELPVEKLWATVYLDDDEAYAIWKDEIGIPEERIVRLGKDDNFWEIGTGPCGPCSEIYFDRGEKYSCDNPDCKPGCDCDRYVEFWNHVFTQFNNEGDGTYTDLIQKNIDTGMGLERIACLMQGVESIFDVDTIQAVRMKAEEISGVPYANGEAATDVSLRIITDHVRSATMMIGDKILPSNEGRGYVLRRLIRRAARHGRKLGVTEAFLGQLVDVVVDTCGRAYPELATQREFIKRIVSTEEERFMKTLDQGMAVLEEYKTEMEAAGIRVLDGEKAFKLHDTYGFPIDITAEILEDADFEVDREGFEEAMARQKQAGKEDAAKSDVAWESDALDHLFDGETLFTGYDHVEDDAQVVAIFQDIETLSAMGEGEEGSIILDHTPFYATGGGQECDLGLLEGDGFKAQVLSVEKKRKTYVHRICVVEGVVEEGATIHCLVDVLHRHRSARNHTATHLLQKALRDQLGEHVEQSGSQVTASGLRFDFTHFEAISKEDLAVVEAAVNNAIDSFMPVDTQVMSIDDAKKTGAMGLFEAKYGAQVRVVSAGDYSRELCGGIHVSNTGQIGSFKILSESGIAGGVRRIEAITGQSIREKAVQQQTIIEQAAAPMKANATTLANKVKSLVEENKELKKELEELKRQMMGNTSADLYKEAEEINGIQVILKAFDNATVDDLRTISDELKAAHNNLCLVLAAKQEDKVTFIVSMTDDVIGKGFHAGNLIKQVAKTAGGGGGGKADMAQAGGKLPEKTEEAFQVARELLQAGA